MSDTHDGIVFREANAADLPAILEIMAEGNRPDITPLAHPDAEELFSQMKAKGTNVLYVAERDNIIFGTYQLALIWGLSATASCRAQVETVRIRASERGTGLGTRMMADAERRARESGASLIQLMSSTGRIKAHRFYETLGYASSHLGFKKAL